MTRRASAKPRTLYRCQACGHDEPKWLGRCPACNEWSSLVEEIDAVASPRAAAAGQTAAAAPIPVNQVAELDASSRLASGIGELDRVLGGGLVPGSLVL